MGSGELSRRWKTIIFASLFILSIPFQGNEGHELSEKSGEIGTDIDPNKANETAPDIHYTSQRGSPGIFLENLTTRGPIIIDGDDAFNKTNGVVSGSGTLNDPYLISGWSINTTGLGENGNGSTAVRISNTTKHLNIEGIQLTNGSSYGKIGVHIFNSSNCSLSWNDYGSQKVKIENSTDIFVIGTIEDPVYSFVLLNCLRLKIGQCFTLSLYADNIKNIQIQNNSVHLIDENFNIYRSKDIVLSGNNFTILEGNDFQPPSLSIFLSFSFNLTENNFIDPYYIEIGDCENSSIKDNRFNELFWVSCYRSKNITFDGLYKGDISKISRLSLSLSESIIVRNWMLLQYLRVEDCSRCNLTRIEKDGRWDAFKIHDSDSIEISHCEISGEPGIYIWGGRDDVIHDNVINGRYGDGIAIEINSYNCIINNNSIRGTIGIENCRYFGYNNIIKGNTFKDLEVGVDSYGSGPNIIQENDFINCEIGIETDFKNSGENSDKIISNIFMNCSNVGNIGSLKNHYTSGHVLFENNTIINCIRGLNISSCSLGLIKRNTFECSEYGISIVKSKDFEIFENEFLDATIAIDSEHTEWMENLDLPLNNTYCGRPIHYLNGLSNTSYSKNNAGELIVWNCTNVSISNMTFLNTSKAVRIYDSSDIELHDMDYKNIETSVGAWNSESLSFNTNKYDSVRYDHYLEFCRDIKIFNNLDLDKDKQYFLTSTFMTWYVQPVAGTNILKGPMIGGNRWVDYTGEDEDGDGFGDTYLPHGPGDMFPLMPDEQDPYFEYNGDITAYTGDPFFINWTITDNFGVESAYIDYNLGGTSYLRKYLERGDHDSFFTYIDIPLNSTIPLYQKLVVRDTSGNTRVADPMRHDVRDNKPPLLVSIKHPPIVETYTSFIISAEFWDNVGVGAVYVETIMPDGDMDEFRVDEDNGDVEFYLHDLRSAGTMKFRFICNDGGTTKWDNNVLVTDWLNITILDKSAPSIGIQSPSNGRYLNEAFFVNYTVEDRESRLSNVSITYYGQTHVLEIEGKLQWMDGSYKINTAGLDDGPMDIILEAANTMGMISRKNVTVIIDRTSPIAEAGQQVTLDPGDPLTLDGTRSFDEFGISSYFWFYRSEETSIRTVIGKEAYLDRIALPGPGVYLVSLIVTDHAGNMGEDTFKVIVKEYSNRPRIIGTSLDDIHGYLKIDIVSISLYFDRPMDLDSFGSSIYFSPDALFDLGISTDGHRIDINFIASLMYDTNYTIRITGGNDTRDIKLEGCPYVLNFETESSPQKEAVDVNDDDGSPILPVILILLTLIALMGAIFFFYSRSKKEYHQEE